MRTRAASIAQQRRADAKRRERVLRAPLSDLDGAELTGAIYFCQTLSSRGVKGAQARLIALCAERVARRSRPCPVCGGPLPCELDGDPQNQIESDAG